MNIEINDMRTCSQKDLLSQYTFNNDIKLESNQLKKLSENKNGTFFYHRQVY